MINQVYRLIAPKQIRTDFEDLVITENNVIIRPTYLSICAADQRYFMGTRDRKVLSQKLPMALIHEAVGKVVYDPKGEYPLGTKVVMIPNTPTETNDVIKDNYLTSTKFRASSMDGFMQNLVSMDRNLIIPFNFDERVAVLLEVTSVIMNAIEAFKKHANPNKQTIGVWGNGNLGFITSLVLKTLYPECKVYVFGVHEAKMNYFSFVDETYLVSDIPSDLRIDHAFECVGGSSSETAINQIIDYINPQGMISLMGVSENLVGLNTRMILEKGLILQGNSRSSYIDYTNAIQFINNNHDTIDYLSSIISEVIEVRSVKDIIKAFEDDVNNEFKTIMKWNI